MHFNCSGFPHKATFRMKFNNQNPFSNCLLDAPLPLPLYYDEEEIICYLKRVPRMGSLGQSAAVLWLGRDRVSIVQVAVI